MKQLFEMICEESDVIYEGTFEYPQIEGGHVVCHDLGMFVVQITDEMYRTFDRSGFMRIAERHLSDEQFEVFFENYFSTYEEYMGVQVGCDPYKRSLN